MGRLPGSPPRLSGLGAAVFATSCTLAYHSVSDADVRFEHCYRLDEERHVTLADKRRCWQDWIQKHTYGQSRDRVLYAFARERALGQAETSGGPATPPSSPLHTTNAAPQPMSAFAPPPQTIAPDAGPAVTVAVTVTATSADGGLDIASTSRAAAFAAPSNGTFVAPGASCAEACSRTWRDCLKPCNTDGCRPVCDDRYRACMRTCF